MKAILLTLVLMSSNAILAQWSGTYYGAVNGDAVVMQLTQTGNNVNGDLKDSQQTYVISGTVSGAILTGTATESVFLVAFGFAAEKKNAVLECKLIIELNGERSEVPFTVEKEGGNEMQETQDVTEKAPEKIPFPQGATFPAALHGKWTKSETYNSGYGDNYMGSTYAQSMTFFSDGGMGDGGSSATMSGSNYSGSSSGDGSGRLPGVGWYAIKNNLYLIAFAEGKWQSIHLGTWYAENNALLITGANGEKQLLTR